MTQALTSFDNLLTTARELAITVVTGQLGPPFDGCMWISGRSLDAIVCPDQSERQVAFLIAPGGPGWTYIRTGRRTLNAADLNRLMHEASAAGGSVSQGWLATRTPETWLKHHNGAAHSTNPQATLEMARAAGWPATSGNDRVLFLDDQPICNLLARGNMGRTVTLLVGSIAEPAGAHNPEWRRSDRESRGASAA